ncbi:MAG: pilus assembly protein PilM [Candidatus Omnitrophica bacterium]|nr:pilus assembly protein PilM [Candidatus Omnitrophota bacterium]
MEEQAKPEVQKTSFKKPANPRGESPRTVFPSFLKNILASTRNVIGIDIGSSYIKIVQLQKSRGGYLINNCVARALPQAIRDNPAEKRKITQGFLKEFISGSRIKPELGRLAVWGKGVFVFSLTIPSLDKKDLKGAVSIELKKRLPFQADINKMVLDFFVTGQARDEKGAVLLVTCIAVEQAILNEHLRFLKDINIRPVAVNVIPDALGNLLPYCIEGAENKTAAVLDVGASISQLNFFKGRELVFSREIPVSGDALTRAMAKTITTPSGASNISFEDAEKIKRNCGIPLEEDGGAEYLTDFGVLRGEQISAMLRPTLERLVMEVGRTMNYYVKTFKAENPGILYLTGGNSRINNFDKFLLYNVEGVSKVERLNIWKAVKGRESAGEERSLSIEPSSPHLAVALGLCLGGGGKVNLLPLKEKVEQKIVFATSIFRILFPLILAVILGLYAVYYANMLKYRIFIININSSITRLEPTVKLVKEYQEINAKIEQRRSLLESSKSKQPLWTGVLKELSNIIPKEVVLQRIEVVRGKEPKEMHLIGRIAVQYTIVDVALQQFIMQLNDSPYFDKVELADSRPDMYSAVPAANFDILCRLKY